MDSRGGGIVGFFCDVWLIEIANDKDNSTLFFFF